MSTETKPTPAAIRKAYKNTSLRARLDGALSLVIGKATTPVTVKCLPTGHLLVETVNHIPLEGDPPGLDDLILLLYLCEEAELCLGPFRQEWKFGVIGSTVGDRTRLSQFKLWLKPDQRLLGQGIDCYPFRVRMQELAALNPGTEIVCSYMGCPPVKYRAKGLGDLFKMLHPDPPVTERQTRHENLQADFGIVDSQMEKMKVFQDGVEVYDHWIEARLRKSLEQAGMPTRRQDIGNVAASRQSYFGVYALDPDLSKIPSGEVYTVPGFTAVIHIREGIGEPEVAGLCADVFKYAVDYLWRNDGNISSGG